MPPGKRGRRAIGTAITSRYRCSGLLGIKCPEEEEEDSDEEFGEEAEEEAGVSVESLCYEVGVDGFVAPVRLQRSDCARWW